MPGPGPLGLLDMMSDQPAANPNLSSAAGVGQSAPPINQAVLDAIAAARATQRNAGPVGSGQGPFQGNQWFEAAAQPGMSGYFDVGPGGNITPRIGSAQQAASEAGVSGGQLAGGMFPGGGYGNVGYNIPNDRGGFFSLQDLFGQRRDNTGLPVGGAAQIGANMPSTNNWRLLGRGPGYIMRNGQIISLNDPAGKYGWTAGGGTPGYAAEGGYMGGVRYVAPGNAFGGSNPMSGLYWPGAEQVTGYAAWPMGTNV